MRWMGWFGKMMLGAMIISAVSVVTTWSMVNLYVEKVLERFHLNADGGTVQLSELLAQWDKPVNSMVTDSDADGVQDRPTNPTVPDHQDSEDAGKYEQPDNAVPVFGQAISGKKELVISAEEFNMKKDSLNADDKMEIFSLLIARLPPEELQTLSQYVEDGVTESELEEIKTIIEQHLEENDYNKLLQILDKY